MKKLLSLLISVLLLTFTFSVKAQTTDTETATPSVTYKLPYPGILPDNPLYKLKVLRDKIMLQLISDPEKKAKYLLNLANKQILASKMLLDKDNHALAKETALKGENEITLITFVYKNANLRPDPKFMAEMELATKKHQEILKEEMKEASADDKDIYNQVFEFSQRNMEELEGLVTAD